MKIGTIAVGPRKVGKTSLYNELKGKGFSQVIFDEALLCENGEVLVIDSGGASIQKRRETVIHRALDRKSVV